MTMPFARLRVESDAMLHMDMLRFVASAGIVWHHSHEYLHPLAERAALFDRTRALALFVDLFFVISGFVIAYVYGDRIHARGDYLRFLQRRVGRLVPLHWLTLALSWLVWAAALRAGGRINHPPELGAVCVAHAALLLNGLFACGSGAVLNGVTWSISAEMALYILFPLLLLGLRRRLRLPVAILLALGAGGWVAGRTGLWDTLHPVLRALPSFLFGMALFAWRDVLRRLPVGSGVVAAASLLLCGAMMTGVPQPVVLPLVWLTAAAAAAADARMAATPAVRRIAPLGQLTYGIYMWHSLVILTLPNILGDKLLGLSPLPMAGMLVLAYGIIMIVSYASLFLVETPARRRIDRLGAH